MRDHALLAGHRERGLVHDRDIANDRMGHDADSARRLDQASLDSCLVVRHRTHEHTTDHGYALDDGLPGLADRHAPFDRRDEGELARRGDARVRLREAVGGEKPAAEHRDDAQDAERPANLSGCALPYPPEPKTGLTPVLTKHCPPLQCVDTTVFTLLRIPPRGEGTTVAMPNESFHGTRCVFSPARRRLVLPDRRRRGLDVRHPRAG